MKIKINMTLLLVVVITFAAKAQTNHPMQWIVGTWIIKTGNGGTIVEQWRGLNDSTLVGKSSFVKAPGDSTLQETLQLTLRKGVWSYISTVQGQNNNQPVAFSLIFVGRSEFISTNPAHDFPQRIAYRRIHNQLLASIEGSRNGKYSKRNFDYTAAEVK